MDFYRVHEGTMHGTHAKTATPPTAFYQRTICAPGARELDISGIQDLGLGSLDRKTDLDERILGPLGDVLGGMPL